MFEKYVKISVEKLKAQGYDISPTKSNLNSMKSFCAALN